VCRVGRFVGSFPSSILLFKKKKKKKKGPVLTVRRRAFLIFGVSFFILCVPVHTIDRGPVRKAAVSVTPSREEAAQTRLLDVRRILSGQNHQQGPWQGP
jgi:hypothetical protein